MGYLPALGPGLVPYGGIPGSERFNTHWMLLADAVRPTERRQKESKWVEKVSQSLSSEPQAQTLLDPGIAYSRGEIDKVCKYAQYFPSKHTGAYAVAGATMELFREFNARLSTLSGIIHQRYIATNLTDRERNVAKLVAFGFTNRQIAEKMGVQDSTVKTTVQKIVLKTGLTDRANFVFVI